METTTTTATPLTLNSAHPMDDLAVLREEIDQLNTELIESNEQRSQAAEYGLVLLEEKQKIFLQYEELSGLYESTKNELENSVNALKQVQADYEKRLKDVETQREQLLEEMETRESSLINEVDKGEEKMRHLERKIKQSATEHDCLNEHNTYLSGELDRTRREVDNLKEENRRLKQNKSVVSKETEDLKKDMEKLERKVENLVKFEEECHRLQEENSTLLRDSHALQEQFESIIIEKEDLEYQNQETIQALNDEREAKVLLETRLREDLERRLSPTPPSSWSEESERKKSRGDYAPKQAIRSEDEVMMIRKEEEHREEGSEVQSISSPLPPAPSLDSARLHSTPYLASLSAVRNQSDLFSEIQQSFTVSSPSPHPPPPPDFATAEENKSEQQQQLESLRKKLREMEEGVSTFKREKKVLEDTVAASSLRETGQLKELETIKDEHTKMVHDKDKAIEELNQRILIRDEQIGQLRNKLTSTTAERTSMEIEVDGLTNEIQRLKVVSGVELDKLQRDYAQEQTRAIELKSQIGVLENQVAGYTRTVEKLENIVLNSHSELTTMADSMRNLQKVVSTLGSESAKTVSPTGSKPVHVPSLTMPPPPSSKTQTAVAGDNSGTGTALANGGRRRKSSTAEGGENGEEEEEGREGGEEVDDEETFYTLSFKQNKSKKPATTVQIHGESHSLRAMLNLREQLKKVRGPLEKFTKTMLERSLMYHNSSASKAGAGASSQLPSSPDSLVGGVDRKSTLDLEAAVSKWKAKVMHKTEELNNLRSIMKARTTTAEVATSSLRSKIESQARAYQTEVTKLKYQIKILKKERDEHLSLRTMYAQRCEDYIDEITRARKEVEKRKQEYEELMVSLEKTIQRKLELSTELEEYKMEMERSVLIPTLLKASRV